MNILIVVGLVVLVVLALSLRALMVGRQVPRYAAYWQHRAKRKAPENALYYVVLGDSAAQGIGATDPEDGYVGQLANKLQSKNSLQTLHIINLSVSGATISDGVREQLPKFKTFKLPADTVITVELGANDMRDFTPELFERDLESLCSQLPPHAVVGNIPYFGGGIFMSREKNVLKANEIVRKIAQKYSLKVADLHRYTKDHDSLRNYGADFFHPNRRGYNNWANAYWEVLEPQL